MSVLPDNTRLIDHFKRVYTIIVGLAITEGCKHLWPLDLAALFEPNLWMFLAFFITVIPIFHGGDRALDHKYSEIDRNNYPVREYLWDIYMLLFMALGFVLIAESIPQSGATDKSYPPFYFLYGATLGFDVLVLGLGLRFQWPLRTNRESLAPYPSWIFANSALSLTAFLIGGVLLLTPTRLLYGRFDPLALLAGILIFLVAVWRTYFDYKNAEAFMFPRAAPQPVAPAPQP